MKTGSPDPIDAVAGIEIDGRRGKGKVSTRRHYNKAKNAAPMGPAFRR